MIFARIIFQYFSADVSFMSAEVSLKISLEIVKNYTGKNYAKYPNTGLIIKGVSILYLKLEQCKFKIKEVYSLHWLFFSHVTGKLREKKSQYKD